MPAITNVRTYFDLLKRSSLLTQQQLVAARDAAKEMTEAKQLAKWLVKKNWLTQWQAQQLSGGHHRLFLGKYKLLEVIGQGGMGAVLKAEQSSIHRIVALKVMAKELVKDEVAVGRFLREIQSASSLNHPHIVAALDAGCIGDRYFLVMECVEGRDLKGWVTKYGPLPIGWTCDVIRQIALGLQHAHERGMVHRDIKPSNIMVTIDSKTGEPHAKIMDFGLSRLVSETEGEGQMTRTGTIMGSPDYIAPEQARNAKEADVRADLFSLGCTMFHMLTGQLPFPGSNVMEKLMARTSHVPVAVRTLRPDIPASVEQIVALLLKLNPKERIQTPQELADRLAALDLTEQPSQEEPTDSSDDDDLEVILLDEADKTLNLFLDQLSQQQPEEGSSISPSSSSVMPRRSQRSSWIASMIAAACLLALLAGLASMSGGSKSNSANDTANKAGKKPSTKPPVKSKKTRD